MRYAGRAAAGVVVGTLILVLGLAGCGAGQQAQTSNQVTATGGAEGRAGSILVRNAQFTFDGPIAGDTVYQPGDDAPLQVTIINDNTATVDDGLAPDRLVEVSSPIATSGQIVGDAQIPDGQVLTAGYDEPASSFTPPGSTAVDITLVGLTAPVRSGLSYPVVFTFERAGELRIEVPVENPDALPPRARDEDPDRSRTLETGPDVTAVPHR